LVKKLIFIAVIIWFSAKCSSTIKESRIESPDAISRVRCIAVLPLENRTSKGMAGYQVAEIVSSELINTSVFGVMEPIETLRTMQGLKIPVASKYDIGRAVEIGNSLGVDGVVIGTLKEFSFKGEFAELNEGNPVVSLELRLLNTKNGNVVWSSEIKKTGSEVTDVSKDYLLNFARTTIKEAVEPIKENIGVRNVPMPCWKPKPTAVARQEAPAEVTVTPPSAPSPPPPPASPQTPPRVTTPPARTPEKVTPPPAPSVKAGPAKIELVNATGSPKVMDNVGMTLLMNNHDLRKMTDQKTPAGATVIYYKPGYETEAGKIASEIKKGKTVSKSDLPADIDIQIILGKDLL